MTYLVKYMGYMKYIHYYSHEKEILIMIEIMVVIAHTAYLFRTKTVFSKQSLR